MKTISYGKLARAFTVMEKALGPTKDDSYSRSCLMKYLGGPPLPLQIHNISHFGNDYTKWDEWPDITIKKLEALLGPHGHTIAKAWLVKYGSTK